MFVNYFSHIIAYLLLIRTIGASPGAVYPRAPQPWTNFNDNPVFYPGQGYTSWRTLYARTLQLPDESILLSWEDYDNTVNEPYFPIYRSTDGGATFSNYSRVHDQVNGWGLAYQPFLYYVDSAFGGYEAGTILIAGASVPRNLSHAWIDLYASTDSGESWDFVSHIVYGPGPETVTNGNQAVWEPFLEIFKGQMVCHYSTQVDPAHAQKLSHKTSSDLVNWSEEVDDVAQPNYGDRPGMTTVAHIESTGKYIMTFEYCGGPITSGCPVYYKVADSPLEFGNVDPTPIVSNDSSKIIPNGSPYVIWTPHPDRSDGSGLIIANGNSAEQVFVNEDSADANGWKAVDVGQWSAYSRSLRIIQHDGQKKLLIANGGNIGCSGSCYNYVADGVVDIPT